MQNADVDMFDVVILKDGREGTVVEIYDKPGLPIGYEVEISHTEMELVTVHIDRIEKVIYKAPKG